MLDVSKKIVVDFTRTGVYTRNGTVEVEDNHLHPLFYPTESMFEIKRKGLVTKRATVIPYGFFGGEAYWYLRESPSGLLSACGASLPDDLTGAILYCCYRDGALQSSLLFVETTETIEGRWISQRDILSRGRVESTLEPYVNYFRQQLSSGSAVEITIDSLTSDRDRPFLYSGHH